LNDLRSESRPKDGNLTSIVPVLTQCGKYINARLTPFRMKILTKKSSAAEPVLGVVEGLSAQSERRSDRTPLSRNRPVATLRNNADARCIFGSERIEVC
jgi:hypothetical protein